MFQSVSKPISRRRFIKTAGVTALAASSGPAIIISGRAQPKTLKILYPREGPLSYQTWLDQYIRAWGEKNDTRIVLDWMKMDEIRRYMDEEAAAQQGHDLFLNTAATAELEDQVIDHRELYEECERRYGRMLEVATKRSYNTKTGKFNSFNMGYIPTMVIYRKDLWDAVGRQPDSWEDVRLGGRRVKFYHDRPVGLGLISNYESEANLRSLLFSFGASVQDVDHQPALKSPKTLEVLKFFKALYEEAMSEQALAWDTSVANNLAMLAGETSLVMNAISITRTAENKQLPVNDNLLLAATPQGPVGRIGMSPGLLSMMIWKFASNIDGAQQFLVDFVGNFRQVVLASQFFYFPLFPQTVPDLAQLLADDAQAKPPGKYRAMEQAADWSVTLGYPGYNNGAVSDIYSSGLIPIMFANVATGMMTPEEALTQADQEVRKVFQKWQDLGKV